MHVSALTRIIVQGIMLHTTIVPKNHRFVGPLESACKLRPYGMGIKIFQQRLAFIRCHATKALGESAVDIERFATGAGVGANNRVDDFRVCVFGNPNIHAFMPALLIRASTTQTKLLSGGMNGG